MGFKKEEIFWFKLVKRGPQILLSGKVFAFLKGAIS
jgi:hypothetical protein